VSNGHATPEVLDYLQPRLTAVKIDLKGFHAGRYRRLGGSLEAITRSIQSVHDRGLWLEVVTLLVPGFNDDPAELRALTQFLAGVSRAIPWHVTAFHPDYRNTSSARTSTSQLMQAAEIGAQAGLKFVYAGNAHGRVGNWEDTRCPDCGTTLVRRAGFCVTGNGLLDGGKCPKCHRVVPGLWDASRLNLPQGPGLRGPGPGTPPEGGP
jgi:pyruvate formate lyase activating enzyme